MTSEVCNNNKKTTKKKKKKKKSFLYSYFSFSQFSDLKIYMINFNVSHSVGD